ncbi:hypothetical protein [Shimia sp. SDUM112013]|uniref:hypothetical protein n=1 Tax=Shimia sp. SDUM112013 TaxID=3136160 RepID=UPI0032F049FD
MNFALFLAAALAGLWAAVHAVMGGRECAKPLSTDEHVLPIVRETMLLCWHLVTGFLVLTSLFLFFGALGNEGLGAAGTAMAGCVAVIGLLIVPIRKNSYAKLPQGWLFVPVAFLGLWGLMG